MVVVLGPRSCGSGGVRWAFACNVLFCWHAGKLREALWHQYFDHVDVDGVDDAGTLTTTS